MEQEAARKTPAGLIVAMLGAFLVTLLVTLVSLLTNVGDKTLLVAVTTFVGALLILVGALPRIVDLNIGPVKATMARLEGEQRMLASDILAIQTALRKIVTTFELDYMRRLANTEPWMMRWDPDLYTRMMRLDDLGFVLPKEIDGTRRLVRVRERYGNESIPVDDREWFNLKEYIEITPEGREYLKLYDEVTKRV